MKNSWQEAPGLVWKKIFLIACLIFFLEICDSKMMAFYIKSIFISIGTPVKIIHLNEPQNKVKTKKKSRRQFYLCDFAPDSVYHNLQVNFFVVVWIIVRISFPYLSNAYLLPKILMLHNSKKTLMGKFVWRQTVETQAPILLILVREFRCQSIFF